MSPLQRRLLLGRTTAALATSLIPTTLTLAIVHKGSGTSALGLVLAAELIPMLLMLPIAGVYADRFPARRIIATADLTRAAAQAAIGTELLTRGPSTPVLATLAAVTGAAVAFGTPAVRTLVSATVSGPDRQRLNAQLSVWQGLAQFAGPAIAGALMLGIGPGWSSLLTAALFVGSALTLGGMAAPNSQAAASARADAVVAPALASVNATSAAPAAGPSQATTTATPAAVRSGFLTDLRAGWTETRRHPWFIANVLGHGVWHLAAGFLLTLGPIIAIDHLGGGTAWVVILQAGTVGMLAGVWVAGRTRLKRPLIAVAIGAAAYALPLAALAATAPLPIVGAAYFAAMFGLGVLDPLWETTIQQRIPAEALGRVGSFDALISFGARPLGLAVAAPIAAAVGTTAPLATAAVMVGAANLAVLTLPTVRATTPAAAPTAFDAAPEPEPEPETAPRPTRPPHPTPDSTPNTPKPAAEERRPAPVQNPAAQAAETTVG